VTGEVTFHTVHHAQTLVDGGMASEGGGGVATPQVYSQRLM